VKEVIPEQSPGFGRSGRSCLEALSLERGLDWIWIGLFNFIQPKNSILFLDWVFYLDIFIGLDFFVGLD